MRRAEPGRWLHDGKPVQQGTHIDPQLCSGCEWVPYGPDDYADLPWRVGRTVGRTIYAQLGYDASDDDVLIGVMDSPALAYVAVVGHNRQVDGRW